MRTSRVARADADGRSLVRSGPPPGYRPRRNDLAAPNPKPVVLTPDGRTIVFFRRDREIYRVDSDGRNLRRS
jgi:hypothetical protein